MHLGKSVGNAFDPLSIQVGVGNAHIVGFLLVAAGSFHQSSYERIYPSVLNTHRKLHSLNFHMYHLAAPCLAHEERVVSSIRCERSSFKSACWPRCARRFMCLCECWGWLVR